jgi:hypothetical protein
MNNTFTEMHEENGIITHVCSCNSITIYETRRDNCKFDRESVYFLCGPTDGKPSLYIGKGKDDRPKSNSEKINYEDVFAITIGEGLNESQKDYLERHFIKKYKDDKRFNTVNGNTPSEKNISRIDKDACIKTIETVSDFIDRKLDIIYRYSKPDIIKNNLPVVEIENEKPTNSFICKGKNSKAYGISVGNNEWKVFSGSTFRKELTPIVEKNGRKEIRDNLIHDGILIDNGNENYSLFKDYVFNSSSQAASLILGGQYSGPEVWIREEDGKQLKDCKS